MLRLRDDEKFMTVAEFSQTIGWSEPDAEDLVRSTRSLHGLALDDTGRCHFVVKRSRAAELARTCELIANGPIGIDSRARGVIG